jgi:transposase
MPGFRRRDFHILNRDAEAIAEAAQRPTMRFVTLMPIRGSSV